jgi:hypothetical protein
VIYLKIVFIISFFYQSIVFADFINSDAFNGTANEVIIDNLVVDKVTFEEPVFMDRRIERDIAQMSPDMPQSSTDNLGQLTVLKEIPFTYPIISQSLLEARVLIDIENTEQNNK